MRTLCARLARLLHPGDWDTLRLVNATELRWIVKLCVLVAWRLCLWSKFRGSARSVEAHAYDPPTWLKRREDPNEDPGPAVSREDRVIAISREELQYIKQLPNQADGISFRLVANVCVAGKNDQPDDEKEAEKKDEKEPTPYAVTLHGLVPTPILICGVVLLVGYACALLPWTAPGVETIHRNLKSYLAVATGAWAALLGLVFAAAATMAAAANPEVDTANTESKGPDRADFSRRLPTLLFVLLAATAVHAVSLLLYSADSLYLKLVGPLLVALSLLALWLLLCAFVSLASLFPKDSVKSP